MKNENWWRVPHNFYLREKDFEWWQNRVHRIDESKMTEQEKTMNQWHPYDVVLSGHRCIFCGNFTPTSYILPRCQHCGHMMTAVYVRNYEPYFGAGGSFYSHFYDRFVYKKE